MRGVSSTWRYLMPLKRPTTTPLPDEIYDEWAPTLGAAELKVLLYIVRRTLGFRKSADAISLSQFLEGIVTRDGRVLDKGCGVKSRPNVVRALKALEDKGLIRVGKRHAVAGDKDTTLYALWWEGDVDSRTPEEGSVEKTPPWCRSNQEVVSQENHGGVAATPTTNSLPTNRQQNSETTAREPASLTALCPASPSSTVDAVDPAITIVEGTVLWQAVLGEMRSLMTVANYTAWFEETVVLGLVGEALTVGVPTATHQHWLDTRLRPRIEAALGRLNHAAIRVVVEVVS